MKIITTYICVSVFVSVINMVFSIRTADKTDIIGLNNKNAKADGIFVAFLRSFLDVLSTFFPKRKLVEYCKVLSSCLMEMDYDYTRKLYKHVRKLSKKYGSEIKDEIQSYNSELDKELPYRSDFLTAMNELFTLGEHIRFKDYIHDLRDYANEDKLFIEDETRKILNDVIIGSVQKISSKDQRDLRKKLKRAVKEYKKYSDYKK